MSMRHAPGVAAALALAILCLALGAPFNSSVTENGCNKCHGSMFFQFLDILEGYPGESIPSLIDGPGTFGITVVVANLCNSGAEGGEENITDVRLTLGSENRTFKPLEPTFWIGDLGPGNVEATWQVRSARTGHDTLVITAEGRSPHGGLVYKDVYEPAPELDVIWAPANQPPSIALAGLPPRLGGESDIFVRWTSLDEFADECRVALYYSTDGFAAVNLTVATDLPNNGTFYWTLPGIDSDTVSLEAVINDSSGAYSADRSSPFAIDSTPPGVAAVLPADGEANASAVAPIAVRFSEPVAAATAVAAFSISPRVANIEWSFSADGSGMTAAHDPFEPGTDYTCVLGAGLADAASPPNLNRTSLSWAFTVPAVVHPVPAISLVSPSGGERYYQSDLVAVRWKAAGGTAPLRVSLSLTAGGLPPVEVAVGQGIPAEGSYAFQAPAVESDLCALSLRVYDALGIEGDAASPGSFAIARRPELAVTFPPGSTLRAGETATVNWTATGGHGKLNISIGFETGNGMLVLAHDRTASGSLEWSVPALENARGSLVVTLTDGWGTTFRNVSGEKTLLPAVGPAAGWPPVATFRVEQLRLFEGRGATFDAGGSFDPDGDALSFSWDFGDGSAPVKATSATVVHSFPAAGTYNVTMTASDGRDNATSSTAVRVDKALRADVFPANAWAPLALAAEAAVLFTAAAAVLALRRRSTGRKSG